MRDVLPIALGWILSASLTAFVLRHDERRMTEVQRARAWPDATRWVAIVVIGHLSLLIHFVRTRGLRRGMFPAIAWTVGVEIAADAVLTALDWVLGP